MASLSRRCHECVPALNELTTVRRAGGDASACRMNCSRDRVPRFVVSRCGPQRCRRRFYAAGCWGWLLGFTSLCSSVWSVVPMDAIDPSER